LDRCPVDEGGDLQLSWEERFAVAWVDELDAEECAAAAYRADHVQAADGRFELVAEGRAAAADSFDETFGLQRLEDRETDGAELRGAVPCMAVLELAGSRRHCLVDVLHRQDPSHGRISGAGRLPEADDVRLE